MAIDRFLDNKAKVVRNVHTTSAWWNSDTTEDVIYECTPCQIYESKWRVYDSSLAVHTHDNTMNMLVWWNCIHIKQWDIVYISDDYAWFIGKYEVQSQPKVNRILWKVDSLQFTIKSI